MSEQPTSRDSVPSHLTISTADGDVIASLDLPDEDDVLDTVARAELDRLGSPAGWYGLATAYGPTNPDGIDYAPNVFDRTAWIAAGRPMPIPERFRLRLSPERAPAVWVRPDGSLVTRDVAGNYGRGVQWIGELQVAPADATSLVMDVDTTPAAADAIQTVLSTIVDARRVCWGDLRFTLEDGQGEEFTVEEIAGKVAAVLGAVATAPELEIVMGDEAQALPVGSAILDERDVPLALGESVDSSVEAWSRGPVGAALRGTNGMVGQINDGSVSHIGVITGFWPARVIALPDSVTTGGGGRS